MAILILSGFASFRDTAIGQSDFAYIWSGPRTLLDGGDPYEATSWSRSLARLGTSLAGAPVVYSYPPYVAVALLPLGALPLAVGYAVWTWGGIAIATASLWALLRTFAPDQHALYAVAPAALLLSQPAVTSFYGGQWSPLVVAASAALAIGLARPSVVLVALSTLVLMAKPQLAAVALLGLFWRSLRRGERSLALAIGGTVVVLGVVTTALTGPALVAWLTEVPRARAGEADVSTLAAAIGPIGAAITLALALGAALRADVRNTATSASWLGLSVLAAPYAHPYDHLMLLVPLVVSARSQGAIALLGTVVLLVLPWALFLTVPRAAGFERLSVIVPIILYGLVALALLVPTSRAHTRMA